jgi:hypothetical protein
MGLFKVSTTVITAFAGFSSLQPGAMARKITKESVNQIKNAEFRVAEVISGVCILPIIKTR